MKQLFGFILAMAVATAVVAQTPDVATWRGDQPLEVFSTQNHALKPYTASANKTSRDSLSFLLTWISFAPDTLPTNNPTLLLDSDGFNEMVLGAGPAQPRFPYIDTRRGDSVNKFRAVGDVYDQFADNQTDTSNVEVFAERPNGYTVDTARGILDMIKVSSDVEGIFVVTSLRRLTTPGSPGTENFFFPDMAAEPYAEDTTFFNLRTPGTYVELIEAPFNIGICSGQDTAAEAPGFAVVYQVYQDSPLDSVGIRTRYLVDTVGLNGGVRFFVKDLQKSVGQAFSMPSSRNNWSTANRRNGSTAGGTQDTTQNTVWSLDYGYLRTEAAITLFDTISELICKQCLCSHHDGEFTYDEDGNVLDTISYDNNGIPSVDADPISRPDLDNYLTAGSAYPNPAAVNSNFLLPLNLNQPLDVSLRLYDLLGKEVYSDTRQLSVGQQEVAIPTNNLKAGIYFYSVETKYGNLTNKIVVR